MIPFRVTLLAASALCFAASRGRAQAATVHWQCRITPTSNGTHDGSCSGDADCNAKYLRHLCEKHLICSGSGSDAANEPVTPPPDPKKAWILAPLALGVTGAAIGGASDVGKSDEQKQADKAAGKPSGVVQGAIIGAGVGLVIGSYISFVKKYQIPMPGTTWLGRAKVISRGDVRPFHWRVGLRW